MEPESEYDSGEEFEAPRSKKAKGAVKGKKPKSKKTSRLTSFLSTPTPEEIDEYVDRPRKKPGRPVETKASKAQRMALAPLAPHRTAVFYMDVRLVNKPGGVISSRNLYPGHVADLEEWITARGENFAQKTSYLTLGNVSNVFILFWWWSVNINIH